jgi:hypothetical protein
MVSISARGKHRKRAKRLFEVAVGPPNGRARSQSLALQRLDLEKVPWYYSYLRFKFEPAGWGGGCAVRLPPRRALRGDDGGPFCAPKLFSSTTTFATCVFQPLK